MLENSKMEAFLKLSGVGDNYINTLADCLKKNQYEINPCMYKGENRENKIEHLSMMMLNKYLRILGTRDEAEKLLSYWEKIDMVDNRIKGDLHVHTVFSDGMGTVNEMASMAVKAGYKWIGFADHSPVEGNIYRLTENKFIERHDKIIEAEETFNIKIYKSIEADISPEGNLMFPDKWRDNLDYVVVSLHEKIKDYLGSLKRIEKAVSSPKVLVFAHPFSGLQPNYDISYIMDLLDVLEGTGTAVEFNLAPQYISSNFLLAEKCKDRAITKAFSTDSHFVSGIRAMKLASLFLSIDNKNILNFANGLPINKS